MSEYEFTLKFRLPDASADSEAFIDALAEAGCDDALVGIGMQGRIALDFTREAKSASDAVTSAVRDVKSAIPGAELIEASPDIVGLTDVAEIAGCTRQNMRKMMMAHLSTFPLAVHEGASSSFWHLASVLTWLDEHQKRQIDVGLLDIAKINMTINIAKEARRLPNAQFSLPKDLAMLLA